MADLEELIERVESGTGADRELDWDVLNATLTKGEAYAWDPARGHEYSTCLTTVVALVEKIGPEWSWGVSAGPVFAEAHVTSPLFSRHTVVNLSPARALLAATLRALKETQHDR